MAVRIGALAHDQSRSCVLPLARAPQDEENSSVATGGKTRPRSGSGVGAKSATDLPPAEHAGWLLTRREHKSLGWKKVYARIFITQSSGGAGGSSSSGTLALYRDDKTGTPETELASVPLTPPPFSFSSMPHPSQWLAPRIPTRQARHTRVTRVRARVYVYVVAAGRGGRARRGAERRQGQGHVEGRQHLPLQGKGI